MINIKNEQELKEKVQYLYDNFMDKDTKISDPDDCFIITLIDNCLDHTKPREEFTNLALEKIREYNINPVEARKQFEPKIETRIKSTETNFLNFKGPEEFKQHCEDYFNNCSECAFFDPCKKFMFKVHSGEISYDNMYETLRSHYILLQKGFTNDSDKE